MSSGRLLSKWQQLCSKAGLNDGTRGEEIINCFTKNNLAYHNLDHVGDCLGKFKNRENEARDPIGLELAIWFHDVIYDPRGNDNEEKSAQIAADFLMKTKWADSVPELILATKHQEDPDHLDARLLCDIDLSILGCGDSKYRKYTKAIRSEYAWVEEIAYRRGRSAVLEGFLKRPFIFSLPTSRELYEKQARLNISRELESLNQTD